MGYQVYEMDGRWAGYGVPAVCDWPDCTVEIDRGLGYKCEHGHSDEEGDGSDPEFDDFGCGLYFCTAHLYDTAKHDGIEPKPDTREWIEWQLTDDSWEQWRTENPDRVAVLREGGDAA